MKKLFTPDTPIGTLVAEFPGAAAILNTYRVDYCCGGERPLKEAALDGPLAPEALLQELNTAWETFRIEETQYEDWARSTPEKLVDHIIAVHHSFLKKNLPVIGELLFKVLQVHGPHHPELFEVHQLFGGLRQELEAHLVKEEAFLFPAIAAGEGTAALIEELEAEHEGAGDALKTLREVTDHHQAPADGCASFRELYRLLSALEQDMYTHVHLENNILFKGIKA